jgi:hypothetical protein
VAANPALKRWAKVNATLRVDFSQRKTAGVKEAPASNT